MGTFKPPLVAGAKQGNHDVHLARWTGSRSRSSVYVPQLFLRSRLQVFPCFTSALKWTLIHFALCNGALISPGISCFIMAGIINTQMRSGKIWRFKTRAPPFSAVKPFGTQRIVTPPALFQTQLLPFPSNKWAPSHEWTRGLKQILFAEVLETTAVNSFG